MPRLTRDNTLIWSLHFTWRNDGSL